MHDPLGSLTVELANMIGAINRHRVFQNEWGTKKCSLGIHLSEGDRITITSKIGESVTAYTIKVSAMWLGIFSLQTLHASEELGEIVRRCVTGTPGVVSVSDIENFKMKASPDEIQPYLTWLVTHHWRPRAINKTLPIKIWQTHQKAFTLLYKEIGEEMLIDLKVFDQKLGVALPPLVDMLSTRLSSDFENTSLWVDSYNLVGTLIVNIRRETDVYECRLAVEWVKIE